MTDECISPLRQRMIEDMSLRHFDEKTQKDYIRAVKNLTIFLGRSPDTATAEDLRLFQLHLTESRVRPPTINFTVTALRFLFTVTLDRADTIKHLTFVVEPRKIPVVLSPEEWRVFWRPPLASSTRPRSASPMVRGCACPTPHAAPAASGSCP